MTISIETRQQIIKEYKNGVPIKQLERFCSRPTISSILKNSGVSFRRQPKLHFLSDKQLKSLVEEYLSGSSALKLSREYGISDTTIPKIIKRAGGIPRDRSEARIVREINRLNKIVDCDDYIGSKSLALTLSKMPTAQTEGSNKDWCDCNWDLMCDVLGVKNGDLFVELYDRGNFYLAKRLLEKYL